MAMSSLSMSDWPTDGAGWLECWGRTGHAVLRFFEFELGYELVIAFVNFLEKHVEVVTNLEEAQQTKIFNILGKLIIQTLGPFRNRDFVRKQKILIKNIKKSLLTRDSFFEHFVRIIDENPNAELPLLKVLIQFSVSKDKKLYHQHLDKNVKHYLSTVLTVKSPPPSVLDCFSEFIANLPEETFKTVILPEITKQVKRNASSVLTSLEHFFKFSRLDLSPYLLTIYNLIVEEILSQDPSIQKSSILVLTHATKLTLSQESLTKVTDAIVTKLSGQIAQLQSRIGLSEALQGITADILHKHPDPKTFATKTATSLFAIVKKETNPDALRTHLFTLSEWLKPLNVIPKPILEFYSSSLVDAGKADKQKIFLMGLSRSVRGEAKKDCGAVVGKALLDIVMKVKQKPTTRAEGMLALGTLLVLAPHDAVVDGMLEKEKLWTHIFADPSSFLLVPEFIVKLEEGSFPYLVELIEVILAKHFSKVKDMKGLFGMIIAVMTKGTWTHRKSILEVVERANDIIPELSDGLFTSFYSYIDELSYQPYDEEKLYLARPLNAEALFIIISKHFSPKLFPELLLVSHSTFISSPNVSNVFRKVMRKIGLDPEEMASVHKSGIIELFYSQRPVMKQQAPETKPAETKPAPSKPAAKQPAGKGAPPKAQSSPSPAPPPEPQQPQIPRVPGLGSPSLLVRDAARFGLCGIIAETENILVVDDLVRPLVSYFNNLVGDWGKLTKEELAIFSTPEGEVWAKEKLEQKEVAPKVVQQKGGKKMEDIKWEQEVRTQQLQKKGILEKEQQAAKEKLLQEENVVRQKVKYLYDRIVTAIQTTASIVCTDPLSMEESLFYIVPIFLRLMRVEPFEVKVDRKLLKLSSRCFKPFVGQTIAKVLFAAFGPQQLAIETLEEIFSNIIEKIEKGCDDILGGHQFALLLPILREVLHNPHSEQLQQRSLEFIARHATLYHVPEIPITAQHLIGNSEIFGKKCHDIIKQFCEHLDAVKDADSTLVLLDGVISPVEGVRLASFEGINTIWNFPVFVSQNTKFATRVWFGVHDFVPEVAEIAQAVYQKLEKKVDAGYLNEYLPIIGNNDMSVRKINGKAIAASAKLFPETITPNLNSLYSLYKSKIPDEQQRKYEPETISICTQYRDGVARSLIEISKIELSVDQVSSIFDFLLQFALLEENEVVQSEFVNAGKLLTEYHGSKYNSVLLDKFQKFLDKQRTAGDAQVRESVVVFMGGLAQHYKPGTPEVLLIVNKLLEALSTPSDAVRLSVAQCLVKLVSLLPKKEIDGLVKKCLNMTIEGKNPSERRGGAFGLAGVTKALGRYKLIKEYGMMDELKKAVEHKTNQGSRQGAIFAFETLSSMMGILFEPQVIQIVPQLLACFGDKDAKVREATIAASKTIMGQLSGPCLKLVLPALLKGLEDRQWRAKTGAIELLGTMAYCQPKHLSTCLPTIVPALFTVLRDSHQNVQKAGKEALQAIGQVIRNPEILEHVPILLDALDDPNKYSSKALQALLATHFVHHIDSPSLSLIMPILKRALNDRSVDTKSQAAKVVGSISRLTEHKDLKPYLGGLMENIQTLLIDPIPSLRAIAAKAVGSLVAGMGEEEFPELIPWLLSTMQGNTGLIERSGAAQGLACLIPYLPEERFSKELLPMLLTATTSDKAYMRQGSLCFFQFLPESWGLPFASYLSFVLPSITKGLADETEYVRDAALKAGQAIVGSYARTATDLLLPTLEEGIYDNNWRIRQSSIELLGEFLRKVTKTASKEIKDISDVIGSDRGSRILSALYLIRSDANMLVQQAAISTWKSVVSNTPKTLKSIIPVLMDTIITSISSNNAERRSLGCMSLQDVVKKLGERVLSTVVPILEEGINSYDPKIREAVCTGIGEVMSAAAKYQLSDFLGNLMPAIRQFLSDESPLVQESAAKTFDVLYSVVGSRAIDEIVPELIKNLDNPDHEISHKALNGLSQMLAVRSNIVLPFVVPKLIKPPLTSFNAKALASVVEASGNSIHSYLGTILPALLEDMHDDQLKQNEDFVPPSNRIVVAINQEGLPTLTAEIVKFAHADKAKIRLGATNLLETLCKNTTSDINQIACESISCFLELMNDYNPTVQAAALKGLEGLCSKLDSEKSVNFIPEINVTLDIQMREIRNRITLGRTDSDILPGFCLPNGLDPIIPIYLNALRSGSLTIREQSLEGLRYIIQLTSTEALKPYVTKITGPLIRIFTEKTLSTLLKCSILQTIKVAVDKGGPAIKIAVIPLQTTFVKAISDNAKEVRTEALPQLLRLVEFGSKADSMIKEILRVLTTAAGPTVTLITAVGALMKNPGDSPIRPETVLAAKKELIGKLNENEEIRSVVAPCISSLAKLIQDPSDLINTFIGFDSSANDRTAVGGLVGIEYALMGDFERIWVKMQKIVMTYLETASNSDKTAIREAVAKVIAVILQNSPDQRELVEILMRFLNDTSDNVQVTALQVIKNVAKGNKEVFIPFLDKLIPPILFHARQKKIRARFAAERALLHLLQFYKDTSIAKLYAKVVDPAKAKDLGDFCKRVLSSLEPSDDEGYSNLPDS